VLEPRASCLHCIVCHATLSPTTLAGCPRCGADNRAWRAWLQAGTHQHLQRVLLGSGWGRLALASLLLPPVAWATSGPSLPAVETVSLGADLALSLAGLLLLFAGRHVLWSYELTRSLTPGFRLGLLPLGGAGFLVFIGISSRLGMGWASGMVGLEAPAFSGPPRPGLLALVAPAFASNTLAAGLYAIYAYGNWLARIFPRPIFVDEGRLLQLVLGAARPRLQFKSGNTYEAVTSQVVDLSRTAQAGLSLKIRAEAGTDQVWEGHALVAVQHWRVVSDKWGRVLQLAPEGPLEYVPDITTPPGVGTSERQPERRAASSKAERGADRSYSTSAAIGPDNN
jgi:hypothetical protein